MLVIKGNIISASEYGKVDITENGYLVSTNGIIDGVYKELPEKYKNYPIEDYGDMLVMQSFSDMHLHAPQYPMLGMGMDLELLDWLNIHTFPLEARFKNTDYAKEVYKRLSTELIKNGTTRVAMFSSLHKDSTLILMDELERAGICGFVGKVNMDQNGSKELEETTTESINETIDWIKKSNFKHIKPIITPRFTVSCTKELMKGLGEIANKYNLPIQSHLSENLNEIKLVKRLYPDCSEYYETYKKYGLWNSKTLMAHCVHSTDKELESIKENGVYVVHCPSSNENVMSGYAHIKKMIERGINVVLGSDIAGGDHLSMFDNVAQAIRASKARNVMDSYNTGFLTIEEAFYLSTSAPNKFFNELPGFAKGNKLHALVLDDSKLFGTKNLSIKERFERSFFLREDNAIVSVYSDGRKVL